MTARITLLVALIGLTACHAAEVTANVVRKPDLEGILRHLRGAFDQDLADGPVVLGVLLDQGSEYRKHRQGEALAEAWRRAFAGGPATEHTLRVIVAACGLKEPLRLGADSSGDPVLAPEAIEMESPAYADVPSPMSSARQLARGLAPARGRKHIVLFSLDWADTEDALEPTARVLREAGVTLHVIGRGAYLSDSYWIIRPPATSVTVRKQDLVLSGADAPFRETPIGWLFDRRGADQETSAGFGPYGLQRLASTSGGTYYVYYPATTGSFCRSVQCLFCSGEHDACETYYNEGFLRLLAPEMASRSEAKAAASRPLVAAVLAAWDKVEDAECLMTRPPLRPGTEATVRGNGLSARFRSSLLKTTTCKSRIRWVERTEAKLEKVIATLDTAIEVHAGSAPRRDLASAELFRAELLALLFNLDQFRAFNRKIELEFAGKDAPLEAETRIVPADAKSCCIRQYRVENLYACHGVEGLRQVDWLDSSHGSERLDRVLAAIATCIDRYHHTPWEISSRRIPLAYFWLPPPSS